MKRLRLGAVLHFIIAIGHLDRLFALDEAFDAYGIKDVMHNMVSGHVWMLYALTICLAFAFALAGLYALSATGDILRLPLTRTAIIVIIVLYSLRALVGGWACVMDFNWLRFFSSVIPAFIAWCYYPGLRCVLIINQFSMNYLCLLLFLFGIFASNPLKRSSLRFGGLEAKSARK